MNEPAPTEAPAVTASATAALIALAEHTPTRARAAITVALAELTPADWAWLGLVHRGHAHSPDAALSRVLTLAAARLATTATTGPRPPEHRPRPGGGVEVLEVPVADEIRALLRGPVREDCYDLRLHAEPNPATDAARTTDAAIAARARHRAAHPRRVVAVTAGRTGTGDRLVA
ncbi:MULTISPECIES: hypothetical protein [Nocardia]|uniref:hypothetical protein n=1 Tax=Nocardia TaxID=1817 RepID=UPI000AEF69B2|nr:MULTISPECIES: hypothetical protein [Nocardia]